MKPYRNDNDGQLISIYQRVPVVVTAVCFDSVLPSHDHSLDKLELKDELPEGEQEQEPEF